MLCGLWLCGVLRTGCVAVARCRAAPAASGGSEREQSDRGRSGPSSSLPRQHCQKNVPEQEKGRERRDRRSLPTRLYGKRPTKKPRSASAPAVERVRTNRCWLSFVCEQVPAPGPPPHGNAISVVSIWLRGVAETKWSGVVMPPK